MMHPKTRALLEKLLYMLAEQGEERTYRYIRNMFCSAGADRRCFWWTPGEETGGKG